MNLNKQTILDLAQHALTFAGGVLIVLGIVDEGTVEMVSGAVLTVIGAAWSLWVGGEE